LDGLRSTNGSRRCSGSTGSGLGGGVGGCRRWLGVAAGVWREAELRREGYSGEGVFARVKQVGEQLLGVP
jgi:hypothetical protein